MISMFEIATYGNQNQADLFLSRSEISIFVLQCDAMHMLEIDVQCTVYVFGVQSKIQDPSNLPSARIYIELQKMKRGNKYVKINMIRSSVGLH